MRKRKSRRDVTVLRGINSETGEFFEPASTHPVFDDVTGDPVPLSQGAFQQGFWKARSPRRGSWNKSNPFYTIYFTYDASLGFPTRAAGDNSGGS